MCFACLGDRIDLQTGKVCLRCGGSGIDPDPAAMVCPLCDGAGTVAGTKCRLCDGTGTVPDLGAA